MPLRPCNLATTQGAIGQIKKDIKQGSQTSLLTMPSLEDAAALCGLVSMDSTMHSNLTVGPPIEVFMVDANSMSVERRYRFEESSQYLRQLNSRWGQRVMPGARHGTNLLSLENSKGCGWFSGNDSRCSPLNQFFEKRFENNSNEGDQQNGFV